MPGYSLCLRLPDIQPCVSGEAVSVLFPFIYRLVHSTVLSLLRTSKSWVLFCGEGWAQMWMEDIVRVSKPECAHARLLIFFHMDSAEIQLPASSH